MREKLDYLENLGISGDDDGSIWLSPFYNSSRRDLGYDVINHMEVDSMFGSMKDLNELLLELDTRGRKFHIL